MNKKGFTLIELLGVLVILCLLGLLIMPIVNSVIKDTKKQVNDSNIDVILDSAYNWSLENSESIPTVVNGTTTVTLDQLKHGGYLKKDIVDVSTNEQYSDSCEVLIKKVADNSDPIDEYSKYYNNYLYTFGC